MARTIGKNNVDVGLSSEACDAIAGSLNRYLAELSVLYQKLRNYHWNVEGESFFTLHEVTEELYGAVAGEIDEVAERILKLGRRPLARFADYVQESGIAEAESKGVSAAHVAEALIGDYRHLANSLRETIKIAQQHEDEGTADDAVGMLKDKEKQIWMLTAFRS